MRRAASARYRSPSSLIRHLRLRPETGATPLSSKDCDMPGRISPGLMRLIVRTSPQETLCNSGATLSVSESWKITVAMPLDRHTYCSTARRTVREPFAGVESCADRNAIDERKYCFRTVSSAPCRGSTVISCASACTCVRPATVVKFSGRRTARCPTWSSWSIRPPTSRRLKSAPP